jgi:hypothetical protein
VKRLLANQIELPAKGRSIEPLGRPDKHLLDHRLAGGRCFADIRLLRIGRHAAEANEPLPLRLDEFPQVVFAELPLLFVGWQEKLCDRVLPHRRQIGFE